MCDHENFMCFVMVCMSCCMYDGNVCVLRKIAHRCVRKYFGVLQ